MCVKVLENAGEFGLKKSRHEIVVDGVLPSGNFAIRDPFQGTKYEMTKSLFFRIWTGEAVHRI